MFMPESYDVSQFVYHHPVHGAVITQRYQLFPAFTSHERAAAARTARLKHNVIVLRAVTDKTQARLFLPVTHGPHDVLTDVIWKERM